MSRYMLDCAVARPPDASTAGWLASAAQRAWAPVGAGHHEAKTAEALLSESQNALAGLVGGRSAWFTPDAAAATAHAVLDLGVRGRFSLVVTSAADPVAMQEQSAAAATELGLPHAVLEVDAAGRIPVDRLPDEVLLATAAANQEIGALQTDLGEWRRVSASAVVLDGSCAFGWSPLPDWWDRLILDPRGWGAPPGAVAVVSREAGRLQPFANVAAAVTAGLSGQQWQAGAATAAEHVRAQIVNLRQRVLTEVPDVEVHGGEAGDLPHVLSISVLYVDGEALQSRLDRAGFAVGSGSACASRTGQPSHVLAAIGGLSSGNVRIGLPPDIPDEALEDFAGTFARIVGEIRAESGTANL